MTDTERANLRLAVQSVKDLLRVLTSRVAELELVVRELEREQEQPK